MQDNLFLALEKYNYWNSRPENLGLKRSFYLEKLHKWSGTNLIKVVTGQRRVGKSYLFKQYINLLLSNGVAPGNIFYFPREAIEFTDIDDFRKLNDLFETYKSELKPEGRVYVFIDEIQMVDGWEHFVNSLSQLSGGQCEVFITGSNSTLLSSELTGLLSGRYIAFEMYPFSFEEYCKFSGLSRDRNSFKKFLLDTGMPEALKLSDKEMKNNYFSVLFDTIVLRDVVQRYGVKNINLLKEVFLFIISNIGNLTSFQNIVKYYKSKGLKTNYETVSTYVEYLLQTYVIRQSLRYSVKSKSVLGAERKIYLNDLGFRNYLLGYDPMSISYNLENYVYISLISAGYKVYTGIVNDKEVDFIAKKNDIELYVQVAYSLSEEKAWHREHAVLESINKPVYKLLVHADDMEYSGKNGVKYIKAWELERKLRVLEQL